MPIEQTDWNGLLFSEAGSLWRLFGSAELIRISRACCAPPSSSSPDFSLLFVFLPDFSFSSPFQQSCNSGIQASIITTIQFVIIAKEPSSTHRTHRSSETEVNFVYLHEVVCMLWVTVYVPEWWAELNSCGQLSLQPCGSLSFAVPWCSGTKTFFIIRMACTAFLWGRHI